MLVSYPDNDEIDQDLAKYLYEQCAILIIEGLPVNSEFGIDLSTFKTGQQFMGVKMIPPGIHYFYVSAIGNDGKQYGPRIGFYHNFKSKEIHVKRWSTADEDFDESFQPSEDYLSRYSDNLNDLDRFLGAYRFSTYKTYSSLTVKITVDILEDLVPANLKISSAPYLVRDPDKDSGERPATNKRRALRTEPDPTAESLLPDLQPASGTSIRFTKIPEKHNQLSKEMDPKLVTQFYLDSTMRLEYVFKTDNARQRLLAEFQFSFVTLIMGHVYSCFEQWRKILILICSADSAIGKYHQFFIDFTRILGCQLEYIPEDLFIDITDTDNLVRHHLDIFFQNCHNIQEHDDALKFETDHLRTLLEQKYGWQFRLEPEDELPVVAGGSGVG
uniref:Protein AAR2 homolog n=1 Tax=Aceria tosichella TaxID=561515 RepID=A0A6G1SI32_9ACAR